MLKNLKASVMAKSAWGASSWMWPIPKLSSINCWAIAHWQDMYRISTTFEDILLHIPPLHSRKKTISDHRESHFTHKFDGDEAKTFFIVTNCPFFKRRIQVSAKSFSTGFLFFTRHRWFPIGFYHFLNLLEPTFLFLQN